MKYLFVFLGLSLLASCSGSYSDSDKQEFDAKIEKFVKKKGWNMTKTSSGLYMEVVQEGTGDEKATFTSEVTLHYRGSLLSGKVVDETIPGKPLVSIVNGLIGGFQEALQGQTAGAKLRLIIPPHLGYGDEDLEKIPPHSILAFEIEVVNVR